MAQFTVDRIPTVKEAASPDSGNPATYDGLRLEGKIDAIEARPPGSPAPDPNTKLILDKVTALEAALKNA